MNVLTFDIEEWFHLLDIDSLNNINSWNGYEPRIHKNVDRILDFLEGNKLKATFFCLGWIGLKYPEIIKKIHNRGFEIGSHTTYHKLSYEHNPKSFREDVLKSINILSDITGKKIKYFRAPGFSITGKNLWAFEVIAEAGIEIDSSVFPAHRAHGGLPEYGYSEPSIIEYNGIELKEFPINVYKVLNKNIIFSGGGYFRLFPYYLIKYFSNRSEYIMTYFHPRDFDKYQPVLNGLPYIRKFKSYTGLKNALEKLGKWVTDIDFIDLKEATSRIDWNNVRKIKL